MKKRYCILMVILAAVSLVACGSDQESDASIYTVYYLDPTGEKLVEEDYSLSSESDDLATVATELMHAMEGNGSGGKLVNPIEPDIEFDEIQIKENLLSVYFTGAYNNKTGVREVLSRAAIAKTMLRLPGIDKVDFYVEDQPLMVLGENIGQMDDSTFVENLGNQGEPQSRIVRLYFADDSGKNLVPVDTKVTYPAAEKLAKLLVDCLIAGPEAVTDQDVSHLLRTVPTGTLLNSVTIRDFTCYLDFSREFAELVPNVTSDVIVYSIVNTLCELPSISRVQFTINSGVRERYGETGNFNKSLERNLDIIAADR